MFKKLAICTFIFFLLASSVVARELECQGEFKGKKISQHQLQSVLTKHQQWLASGEESRKSGKANLCGVDLHTANLAGKDLSYIDLSGANLGSSNLVQAQLFQANLFKAYLRDANLQDANLQEIDLQDANLENANLSAVNLRLANLSQANFVRADLHNADLRGANLFQANLMQVNLKDADLTWARLEKANLEDADLSHALFEQALLRQANLSGTSLKDTDFSSANFKQAIYQPRLGGLPNLVALAMSENFSTVRLMDDEGLAALVELRTAYEDLGMRSMERTITAMVKKKQMQQAWQRGGWGYLEASLNYVLFYLTSDFGAAPGRLLQIFLFFIFLFAIFYRIALSTKNNQVGIEVFWTSRVVPSSDRAQVCQQGRQFRKLVKKQKLIGCVNQFRQQLRLSRIALYFSFLSSFSIGWQELNISNWILRLQKREYVLKGCGWVRALAGSQSLISAYLLVMWILTYFGRPFEW